MLTKEQLLMAPKKEKVGVKEGKVEVKVKVKVEHS